MNQIELITALPKWQFKPNSAQEIEITGEQLVDASDFVWRVGNVAVAGFIYNSYLSPPWMWFVLAENVGIKDLVDFRRIARGIPRGTTTAVASDFGVGLRFARLYGFEFTGDEREVFGRKYWLMRKV